MVPLSDHVIGMVAPCVEYAIDNIYTVGKGHFMFVDVIITRNTILK